MLNQEIYEYKLDHYIKTYPNVSEHEFVVGNIFQLRNAIIRHKQISQYAIQNEALEICKKKSKKDIIDDAELKKIIDNVKAKYKHKIQKAEKDIKFYEVRLNRLLPLNATNIKNNSSMKEMGLRWSGTSLELVELIKSLIEGGKFTGQTEIVVFTKLFDFFKFENVDKREKLQTIKLRTKEKTPFLNSLIISLEGWINTD